MQFALTTYLLFFFVTSTLSEIMVISPCIVFNNNTCIKCQNRYYLSNQTCVSVSSLCDSYDLQGLCLNCTNKDFIVIKGHCTDPNCLAINITQCGRCKNNFVYQKQRNQCLFSDPNCHNITSTFCLICKSGFYQSIDICRQLPLNCKQADKNGICIECVNDYYIQFNQCWAIIKNISNCIKYNQISSKSTCLFCSQGYILSQNQCVLVPQDCAIYFSTGQCGQCNQGFNLSNYQCKSSLLFAKCNNINNAQCLSCKSPYLYAGGNCYISNQTKCITFIDGRCQLCEDGYTSSGKTCLYGVLVDKYCKIYSKSNCTECYPGFYLMGNRCRFPNPFCKQFNISTGGCLSCYQGYILTNMQCSTPLTVTNCLNYDIVTTGNCLQCAQFYVLINNTCIKVNPLCRTYNSHGDCTGCYLGYYVSDTICIEKNQTSPDFVSTIQCKTLRGSKCIECPIRSILKNNVCQQVSTSCQTYNETNGNCLSCYSGYILTSANCTLQPAQSITSMTSNFTSTINITSNLPYCDISSQNNSYCIKCSFGFYSQNGTCSQVTSFCQTYDQVSGVCYTCQTSYVFQDGVCIFPSFGVDSYCLKYANSYCIECVSGYYLKNYLCSLIDPHCVAFDFNINQCLSCSSGVPIFDICQ